MNRVLIFMLFILTGTTPLFSQELWYPGWVVLNNKDTLRGKLNYNVYTLDNFRFVKIKDAKGAMRKILAQHMLSYKVGDYRYIRHVVNSGGKDIANDQAMIKCVVEGSVEVWEYEFDPHVARPSMPQAGGFTEGTQKDFYLKTNGNSPVFISRLFVMRDLESVLEDHALLQEILENKKLRYEEIPQIIAEYNQRKKSAQGN